MKYILYLSWIYGVIYGANAFPANDKTYGMVDNIRPDPVLSRFGKWSPAQNYSRRSPCPMLNAMANHGILPHNGRIITQNMLRDALKDDLLIETYATDKLIRVVEDIGVEEDYDQVAMNLNDLNKHGIIEHDVSLTRFDFGFGNNVIFQESLYKDIYKFTKKTHESHTLSLNGLAQFMRFRYDQCKLDHKKDDGSWHLSDKDAYMSYLKAAFVFLLFKENAIFGQVRMDWLDEFFRYERLPIALGWKPRSVTMAQLLPTMAALKVNFGIRV